MYTLYVHTINNVEPRLSEPRLEYPNALLSELFLRTMYICMYFRIIIIIIITIINIIQYYV